MSKHVLKETGKKRKNGKLSESANLLLSPAFHGSHTSVKNKKEKLSHTMIADEDSSFGEEKDISENDPVPVFLTVPESEELLKMTVLEIERKFQEKLQCNAETDLKDAIILDYFVAAAYWGQQQQYDAEQLCGFLIFMNTLIHKIIEEHSSLVEIMKVFQSTVAVSDTDGEAIDENLKFFNTKQIKAIINYLYSSLFQHHKLYHYVFSRIQGQEIIISELSVELPVPAEILFPPSLDEGMPESLLNEYLSYPTPSTKTSETSKSVEVELPPGLEDIFASLTPEDVRTIVNEVSTAVLTSLQADIENKIRTQEDAVLGKINKIHNELSWTV